MCSLVNKLNRPVDEKLSILDKNWAYINRAEIFHVLGPRHDKTALLIITNGHSEDGTRNCLHRLNQIYKTLINR